MLKRNEVLLGLQSSLARKIKIPNVLVDDILTLDANKAPFLVIRPSNTEIRATNSDTWKHAMSLEFEILAPSKDLADHLLEQVLEELEIFSAAHKDPKGIRVEKVEIAATPLYALILELDMVFFTPSFRS
ncbi:hypothetical protein NHP200010_09800 [Helicobacter bizzozeronii]|uniref:hypothetical protein n=1 Tax=Helicobacter bizzozeronii TaxID=56877 RepID=UPI00244D90C9|nr:hypothetical protein [Helicobacter bizzozeronii]GMB93266.1 hypothetical protein NHP200010_09800 [Helicobacter bizzozeronii]